MEWVKERVFECEVKEGESTRRHRIFLRHRSDGVCYFVGSPQRSGGFDDHHESTFKSFLKETTGVRPMSKEEFDEDFERNMKRAHGEEIQVQNLEGA